MWGVQLSTSVPVIMAKIKKKNSEDFMCWQGCGERGTILHCWWDCKMVKPLWKSVLQFLRKLGMSLPEDPAIIYREDSPACNKDTCSTMFIADFIIIIIYDSQNLEGTQISLKGGVDSENVVYLYNGRLLSN